MLDALEERMADDRLEGIELQLSAFGRHGDGDVVADDLEGDLVDHLGDDRIDLARHDRGARARSGRLISFRPPCGPLESRRRSLQTFESLQATRLSTPESWTKEPVSWVASMRLWAGTSRTPANSDSNAVASLE